MDFEKCFRRGVTWLVVSSLITGAVIGAGLVFGVYFLLK
jgi:hypothetical protein